MNTLSAAPSRSCPQCGAPIPAGATEGLCPRCLLALNLATQTHLAGETQPPAAGGAPVVPPLSLEEVAKLFPQLEIIRLVGTGGMGAVYQARQPALDRHVALKLLHTPPANDPGFAERFAQEARALAKLNHPNIVALHEFGQAGGRPYFLMEFVDGVNLRQLQQAERLSPREALQIVPQVCDALQYAHDEGIVHRDIKPENVLMDRKGRVKVADFGLAKLMGVETAATRLTAAGHVMGTPHYMAPEQVEHPLDVDHRADIFSLGVVFYELLTGELPLGKFPLPSKKVQIDVRLDEVVLRALEKEPALRYSQASELKTQVETIAGESHSAQASSVSPRTAQIRPSAITTYIAAGLCCIALLMGLLLNSAGGIWVVVIGATGLAASLIKLKLRHTWPFGVGAEATASRPLAWKSSISGKEAQAPARGMAYVPLGCLVAGLVSTPVFFAISDHRGEGLGLVFAAMTGLLALVFGALARRERLGRVVLWVTASVLVIMMALGVVRALVRNAQFRAVADERQRQADGWPLDPKLVVESSRRANERPRFHVEWPASSWRVKNFASVETKDRFFLRINGVDYPLRTPHEPYAVRQFDLDPVEEGVPVAWLPGKYRAAYVVKNSDYVSPLSPQSMFSRGENASNEVEFEIPPVATGAPIEAKKNQAFGPVIERMMDGALDLDTGRISPKDANSGLFVEMPEALKNTNDLAEAIIEGFAWAEGKGLDAIMSPSETCSLGMHVFEQAPEDWDRLTAAQVVALLDAVNAKPPRYTKLKSDENATYVFRTREGARGVLQIQGKADGDKQVKLRYKLVTGGLSPSAPLVNSVIAENTSESPRLEYLAWQDEVQTNPHWQAWRPNGEKVDHDLAHLPDSLPVPGWDGPQSSQRMLCLWFSHPQINIQSFADVRLWDDQGRLIDVLPAGFYAAAVSGETTVDGNRGWVLYMRSAGPSEKLPATVDIQFRYGVGPWASQEDISVADTHRRMPLAPGIVVADSGQDANGKAFVAIEYDSAKDVGDTAIGILAITKDGRTLPRPSVFSNIGDCVTTQTFTFDVPLDQVAKFVCRKRPIRMAMFKHVPLQSSADDAPSGVKDVPVLRPADGLVTETWAADVPADFKFTSENLNPAVLTRTPEVKLYPMSGRSFGPDGAPLVIKVASSVEDMRAPTIIAPAPGALVHGKAKLEEGRVHYSVTATIDEGSKANQAPGKSRDVAAEDRVALGVVSAIELGQTSPGIRRVLLLRFKKMTSEEQVDQEGLTALQAWLPLMDAGRYAESWDAAGERFRHAGSRGEWVEKSEKIRRPLGEVISRTFTSTQQTKVFPGMPDGSYWLAELDSTFPGLKSASETVVFAREKDGRWRMIGYWIRPRTEEQQAAVAAARAWLMSIDEGHYGWSWTNAAKVFRDVMTQEKWVIALEGVRGPLGERVFRVAEVCQTTESWPGAPAGKYVVMRFSASFADCKSAVETVTFVQENDGMWRAAGYFIK